MACRLQASVTCAATGPVRIKDVKRISGPEGGEVFSEQKGLNFFQNKVGHVLAGTTPRRSILLIRSLTSADNASGAKDTAGTRDPQCAVLGELQSAST